MSHPPMDNGDAFMRAQREAQNNYTRPWTPGEPIASAPYEQMSAWVAWANAQQRAIEPVPEPEDTTGLKLLDEFLTKRRSERHGDERE